MSITSNIANVASALTTGSLVKNLNADLLDGKSGSYYSDLSNTSLDIASSAFSQANSAFDTANSAADISSSAFSQANSAFDAANTANDGVALLQGVNESQNTSITIIQGVDNTQNVSISAAFSKANSAFDAANTVGENLSSNVSLLDGINSTQNTSISASFGQANSAFGAANIANADIIVIRGVDNTQNVSISAAFSQANSAFDVANTKFNSSGGNIGGPVTIDSSLLVTGNFTVSGNVTTVSANNLIVQDNMIYLNDGLSGNVNPDLGIAGAYNDGTYRHTGLFRDASDGIWKVFDNYEPEPDESVWIDTSNNTFRIADFRANNIFANTFSGVANNSNFLDGHDSSYFATVEELTIQSGINSTQNTSISAAFEVANTATADIILIEGVNDTQNTNIGISYNQANSAFDAANSALSSALAFSIALG